ncbi:MAG TPA: cytochrome c3 family protein [Candidatus Methanoperedens sp.]
MTTLLEYITFVKGVEYLIVIAFCFGFIALWSLVNSRDKAISKVVSLVVPLSLVFGGGAVVFATYGNTDTAATANVTNISEPELPGNYTGDSVVFAADNKEFKVTSDYLSIKYGPATKFHQVMSTKVSCTTCHHNSKDEIHACKDCHKTPTNPHNGSMPGLKAAYHQRCKSCHEEDFGGPESCTKCHTGETKTSIVQAPSRPHQLTWETCNRCHKDGIPNGGKEAKIVYHDSCINCHSKGVAGAAKIPDDHAGRTGSTCQGCHKPVGG